MTDSVANVPILSNGTRIGEGEFKDDVLTIVLHRGIGANYVDYIKMGLLAGFNLVPVHIAANPKFEFTTVDVPVDIHVPLEDPKPMVDWDIDTNTPEENPNA